MSNIDGYTICVIPPFDKHGQWMGYAKNDNHSPLLDGGDDPTPDETRAFGITAGLCADAVVLKLKAYKESQS